MGGMSAAVPGARPRRMLPQVPAAGTSHGYGRPQSAGARLGGTGHDRGRSSTGQGTGVAQLDNLSQVSVLEAGSRIARIAATPPRGSR